MSEKVLGLAAMNPAVREKLFLQLRVLKKGVGLTPELSGGHSLPYLRDFVGVTTPSSVYTLIRAALSSMNPSHLYVQALLNAYGGEGLADDLKTRRVNFAQAHGIKESRVVRLEDFALDEMVQILDAHAQGKEIKPFNAETLDTSTEESSVEEQTVKDLLIRLIEAVEEQTMLLRTISTKLSHR
ncbi:hypothetical protein ACIBBE_11525 [Streptomyces sp. NPDC051644]|uniref:hypothetical protein n=1 Tax=Streptomyces sp. NPDC051644 TaxID=3365666 RepID=UPI0037989D8D